ncbi:hypothetical protein ACWC4D_35095 [Streptomyces sp. NPDC001288]|uniref:hypothetical protein n=1 Tax=Streptomyces sp. NPDC001297 TaxID=3364559 RepID=UPI0036CCF9E0
MGAVRAWTADERVLGARVIRRWRTAAGRRGCARTALALTAAPVTLLAALLLPASPVAADDGSGYAFAPGARTVEGAAGSAGAEPLEPGTTYRSTLPDRGKLYFRLELAAGTTAYVPVTAVPPADATVSASDGIGVSVEDANGATCGYDGARFGAGLSPRPVTALGRRDTGRTLCKDAGTYYVVVERLASGSRTTTPGSWDLEIAPVTEPGLVRAGATTAPGTWDSASPEPVTGTARRRTAGAGFATARTLGPGVWRTGISPGQTLYYAVPVDWGQQLAATVELGSGGDGHGYVSAALNLSLYNPVRGSVEDASLGYDGTQKASSLAPLPPVAYANRYAVPGEENAVRFAGAYYLVVHLTGQTADTFGRGPYDVTLRVRVGGTPESGPRYAGSPVPKGVFDPPSDQGGGLSVPTGGDGTSMRLLAAGGIGTGTALLLVLGVWTLTARRAQIRANAQKPTA